MRAVRPSLAALCCLGMMTTTGAAARPGSIARVKSVVFTHFTIPLSSYAGDDQIAASSRFLWLTAVHLGPYQKIDRYVGIVQVNGAGRTITYTWAQLGFPNALRAADSVTAFAGAADGSVWVGFGSATGEPTLIHVSPAGRILTRLLAPPPERTSTVTPLTVDRTGSLWAGEVQDSGRFDSNGLPIVSNYLIHVSPSGSVARTPVQDTVDAGGGAVTSDGALWYSATSADESWVGLTRLAGGQPRRVVSNPAIGSRPVAGPSGTLWSLPLSYTARGVARQMCTYVAQAALDGRGRLWTVAMPSESKPYPMKLAYIDQRLAVHTFPIPKAIQSVGDQLYEFGGHVWLEAAKTKSIELYRADKLPPGHTVCRGLRKYVPPPE